MGGEGETVYCFVIGMLHDLLVKERAYLQAFASPVDELETKLTRMEELLEYANVRCDKRTKEIIELADQFISSIETYVHCVVFKTSGRNFLGIKERLLRPKVCLAIENITTKLKDFINSQSDVDASSLGSIRRAYKVQDLSNLIDENDFVGREKDINKLVSYLVDEESEKFRVISIHGMGGLGKSTLVRKVYKHDKVLRHFEGFAFVCVSEQCQKEAVLKHILQQLVPQMKEEEIKKMSDMNVIDELLRVQGEKKCLVIIDDIWSVGDWEDLNRGLPNGFSGSKVVLTTRIKDVADKGFCFSIYSLSEDESWELLRKKIFMDRDSQMDQRKEELGRKMIAWCCGVPLAVLVLRGVLVTKGSAYEWQRFYESRQWGGDVYEKFNAEVEEELLFSYNDLPYPLKPCFLCLAYFAEDEEIDVPTLYRLWDGEGMILSKDKEAGETMFDVAKRYLGELVGRSIVEAKLQEEVQVLPNGRRIFQTCRLHDLMRGLCLSIAKKENFLMYRDYRGHGDGVVVLNSTGLANGLKMPARQALNFHYNQDYAVDDNQEANRHVTSLIFKGGCAKKISNLNLKKLNSLRVLKFDKVFECVNEDYSFNKLIHLRYLELNFWYGIEKLPLSIDKLIYLQTLDLQHIFSIPTHDGFLRKLKRLRHLLLPLVYWDDQVVFKLRTDGLIELETIVNFYSRKFEMKDVIQLSNLRILKGTMEISSEDDGKELAGGSMNKWNLEPRFSSLQIILGNSMAEMYWDVIRGQVAENFKGIVHELDIRNLRGKLLPGLSNYGRLTELRLNNFEVEEDPMSTLEKLPSLEKLQLHEGKLKGIKEMACSAMSFPKLTDLWFQRVENWEKWRVEEGAMPNLYDLHIQECRELEMVPDGLKFITSLEILDIKGMGEGFKKRLSELETTVNELHMTSLRGKLLPEFPNYGRLTRLWLEEFEFEEDPMSTLEKLPSLEKLKLEEGKLKRIKEMACSATGFPQLRVLKFYRVDNWKKWMVEEGAMPNLCELRITKCSELEMIPNGLKFITSLKKLCIVDMGEGFERRLKGRGSDGGGEDGEDFHKIQHVPHVHM